MIRRNIKTGERNHAAGYVRRSTDRQEQSIPDQKKALESYCVERDLRLVRFYPWCDDISHCDKICATDNSVIECILSPATYTLVLPKVTT